MELIRQQVGDTFRLVLYTAVTIPEADEVTKSSVAMGQIAKPYCAKAMICMYCAGHGAHATAIWRHISLCFVHSLHQCERREACQRLERDGLHHQTIQPKQRLRRSMAPLPNPHSFA
jgi:hypothetical protein